MLTESIRQVGTASFSSDIETLYVGEPSALQYYEVCVQEPSYESREYVFCTSYIGRGRARTVESH
jgi:hypothetical protein